MAEVKHNQTAKFAVKIGSLEASQKSNSGVEAFFVEEHLDMVGMAQITLRPNQSIDFSQFKIGEDVSIKVSGESREWKGIITGFRLAVEGNENKLTIIAMDPLCKLSSSRHTRTWEDMADSDIVSDVLGKAGVSAGTVTSTSGVNPYVFQRNESDLNFLKRLAARNGFVLRAVEGKVNFEELPTGDSQDLESQTAKALEFTWTPMGIPPKVKVHGYDYLTKTETNGEHGSFTPIGGGQDPVAYGNKKIWQEDSHISDMVVTSDSGASAIAAAELERLGRNFLRGRAVVDGDGNLYPGGGINWVVSDKMKAETLIISTRHIVTTQPEDFRTEVTFSSNTSPN